MSSCSRSRRGGSSGPNYDVETVADTLARLRKAGLPERVVVDASHGNSSKNHEKQVDVVTDIAERIVAGEKGIVGLMLESFIEAGCNHIIWADMRPDPMLVADVSRESVLPHLKRKHA